LKGAAAVVVVVVVVVKPTEGERYPMVHWDE